MVGSSCLVVTFSLLLWCTKLSLLITVIKAEDKSISYVIDPFESIDDDWHETVYNGNGALEISLTNDALFGEYALQVEYSVEQTETWGGFVAFSFILNATSESSHNCVGANYLSLWYKIVDPQSLPGRVHLRIILFDDSDCDGKGCDSSDGVYLENYYSFHYVMDGENGNGTDWKELRVELRGDSDPDSPLTRTGWVGTVGNNVLDLDHLRGWKIELSIDSQAGMGNSSDGILLVDQLACVGGGELVGAPFHGDFKNMTEDGVWKETYYMSQLSQNRSQAFLQNGMLYLNFTIEQVQTRGGFISYEHLAPGPAYYNLSQATEIVMIYSVIQKAAPPGLANFELVFMKERICESNCSSDSIENKNNLEIVSERFYILDSESSGVIEMVLNSTKSFNLFSEVKGYNLKLNMDDYGVLGALVSGFVTVGNMTAVLPRLLPMTDSVNTVPNCINEPDVIFNQKLPEFTRVEFLSRKCCDTCAMDPKCLYAQSDDRDCYMAYYVNPNSVALANTRYVQSKLTTFWMDDDAKRGDFCELCECNREDRSIDCRGQHLTIIPSTFFPEGNQNNSSWTPRLLDLRDNPRITFIGSGALASLSNTLEELRLPKYLNYLAFEAINSLETLKVISFEEENKEFSGSENILINVITHPSGFFEDICCGLGKHIDLVLPEDGLTFCDMRVDTPGVDSVMEPYVEYYMADTLQMLLPSSDFMSEAAESAEKCAEYCTTTDSCMYFSYDARWKEAEHRCYLLADNGTKVVVCCKPDDYSDLDGTLPGWTSGRSARTRHKLDNARVLTFSEDLVLNQKNGYKTQLVFSLGSTPLRGAVWIEPKLASVTDLNVSFYPERVVLYDENMTATVNIKILNAELLTNEGVSFVVKNVIQSCDVAFTSSTADVTSDIFLKVNPLDQLNYLGKIRIVGYVFTAIIVFTSLALCIWTHTHRDFKVVKASQPNFLIMLCVGVIILGAGIIPFSVDDEIASSSGCNIACMALPWLFFIGFCICFSALFSKLWRINQIMESAARCRRITVTERDVLGPFSILFSLNLFFLILWTIMDPLRWVRFPVTENASDSEWNTYGRCVSSEDSTVALISLSMLFVIDIGALFFACYEAYRARNISDDFSESKYIAAIIISWLQLSIVGLPVASLIRTNIVAMYLLITCLLFVSSMSLLLLIFVPKLVVKYSVVKERTTVANSSFMVARKLSS